MAPVADLSKSGSLPGGIKTGRGSVTVTSNVLIVEDSADVRAGLQIALESQGYEVRAASDGREGINMFRESQPDIALLDIRMPRLSGIDVCTLIRNESDVPIIMFSGVNERADVLLALQRGADDYVLKDTGFRELLNRVSKHIKRRAADLLTIQPANRGAGRVVPFSPAQAGKSNSGKPKADLTGLNVQTVKIETDHLGARPGGEPLEKLVIVAHSEPESLAQLAEIAGRTGFEVVQASTGREAIEILADRRPKLVVLGSALTDMNCLNVIQAVSNHSEGDLMGIVLAMSKRSPELARRARYMGVQQTVFQPWNDGRLDIAIRSTLIATRKLPSRSDAA